MINIKCPKCDWKTGTKLNKMAADLSLRMHNARVHVKTVTPPGQVRNEGGTPPEPKLKRPYNKRHTEEQGHASFMDIKFCPQCGMNLSLLAKAASLVTRMRNLRHGRTDEPQS